VKSWLRFCIAATAVLLVTLSPKLLLGVLRSHAPEPLSPVDGLRAFLAASTGGRPVTPILARHSKTEIAGWAFNSDGCVGRAFLSSLAGNLDYQAQALAQNGAHIAYIYRGLAAQQPPKFRLTTDVIAFRLESEFTPTRKHEPRYVVLVYPDACPAPLALPWGRLRLN
jgi:hypothetical protein